jgi:CheY-like chemotaxis protein
VSAFIVLLVEDDPDDVFFLQRAFDKAGRGADLRVVRDGDEALAYLSGTGAFADRSLFPLPSLILLDLKLPRKSGFEVLEWCRRKSGLSRIPVVVLTSSQSQADVARAYDLGANSYLVKPLDTAAQAEMVRSVCEFWAGFNRPSSA